MTHTKQAESDRLPPYPEDLPEWDAAPLDWRTLPIDEIQHERMIDDRINQSY